MDIGTFCREFACNENQNGLLMEMIYHTDHTSFHLALSELQKRRNIAPITLLHGEHIGNCNIIDPDAVVGVTMLSVSVNLGFAHQVAL